VTLVSPKCLKLSAHWVIVPTSSACRDLLLIQLLNKQQILGMRSLSALLPHTEMKLKLNSFKTVLGNRLDKLRQPRSVAYSAKQVLLNKQHIWCGRVHLDCYPFLFQFNFGVLTV